MIYTHCNSPTPLGIAPDAGLVTNKLQTSTRFQWVNKVPADPNTNKSEARR